MKGIYSLKVKKHDTLEDAKEKNDKLINMVKNLEKKVNNLGTQNTALQKAFDKTEVFLKEVTKGVSLTEILKNVEEDEPLKLFSKQCCPQCDCVGELNKIESKDFYIVLCKNCGYRKKVNNYDNPERETE